MPRLIAAARELLVRGGPDAVVVREVARTLSVAPSAMYKHVKGRDELLAMVVAACYAELADRCIAARDAVAPRHHRARLQAAMGALRQWATAHPTEFTLLFANPRPFDVFDDPAGENGGYTRFGIAFIIVLREARDDGRLLVRTDLPVSLAQQLARAGEYWQMSAVDMFPVVMGLQRMLGIVAVEVTGQLAWALTDPAPYTDDQLAMLVCDLLTPGR